MANAEDMMARGAPAGIGDATEAADSRDLNVLLAHIAEQIALTTRRESEALAGMRARAAGLAHEARMALSGASPEQFKVLERIEDRITGLADQLAVAQQQAAPVVDGAWDAASAEELTRAYEATAGADDGYDEPPVADSAANRAPARTPPAYEPVHSAPAAREPAAHRPSSDWLEARFGVIAERLEHTLTEFRPESSLVALGPRFDRLEQHVDSVLQTISSRPDEGTLNLIEAQVVEISASVRDAQQQLGQLDQIESQLKLVATSLSDERMTKLLDQRGPAGAELEQVVQQAARQAAERLAAEVRSQPSDAATAAQMSELRALFEGYVNERRASDDMTAAALDTLQQAMISLLDRVENMERRGHAAGNVTVDNVGFAVEPPSLLEGYDTVPDAYRSASDDFDNATRVTIAGGQAAQAHASQPPPPPPAGYAAAAEDLPDLRRMAADFMPGHGGDAPRPELTAAGAIERIRQELIADAQRAKLKASGDGPMSTPAIFRTDRGAKTPAGKEGKTSILSGASGALSGIPTKRLLIGALALLVAINGALLLMPRKSNGPANAPSASVKVPAGDAATPGNDAPPAGLGRTTEPDTFGVPQQGRAPAGDPSRGSDNVAPPPRPAIDQRYSSAGRVNYNVETASVPDAGESRNLPGVMLQDSGTPPSGEALARAQQRESMAHASTRLGARLPPTAAAYIPDDAPTSGRAPVTAETAARGNPELPPVEVGPLSLRVAAANGDPSAQFEVAARLAEGKGLDQNLPEAVRWYQKSAARGFAQSQYRLATLYERGLGVKADPQRARVWYQRAAEQGSAKAMHNLAVLLASKDVGAPDYVAAVSWFAAAAELGLADSQFNLAVLAEAGLGTQKDLKAAYKWFALAGNTGDQEAQRRRNLVRGQLDAGAITEAEAQVRAFQARPMNRLANDARAAGEDWKSRQNADNNN